MSTHQIRSTVLGIDGMELLREDLCLACAPCQQEGESRGMFAARVAGGYYISLSDADAILRQFDK